MTTSHPVLGGYPFVSNSTTPRDYSNVSDDDILLAYDDWNQEKSFAARELGHVEQELIRRMTERGATAIPSEAFIAELEVKNTYDQPSLTPLLEIFNLVELEKCYEPAYSKTVEVPARWKTQQVIAAAKRRGAEALAIIERAKLPSAPKLRFERRPQKGDRIGV